MSPARAVQIDLTFQLALQGSFQDLALWLPVPQDTSHQRRLALECNGNHAKPALHHDPAHGAPILFVRWPGVRNDPRLTVSVRMETQEAVFDLAQASMDAPLPEDARRYLAESVHLPVEGAVRTRAEAITQGRDTPAAKLRALYDWVLTHAQRRFDVAWCGLGPFAVFGVALATAAWSYQRRTRPACGAPDPDCGTPARPSRARPPRA